VICICNNKRREALHAIVIIRKADPGDIPDLIKLLKELFIIEKDFRFNAKKQREGLKLLISNSGKTAHVLVAEHNGRCVGMITAQVVISTAEGANSALIEDMVISKNSRRKGIGSKLICAMASWCKACGIGRMQLLVYKDNLHAVRFYRNMGWRPTQLLAYRKYN
jgi:GNAT superfamily N-acetyltransferase